jgi:uncharacterized protein Smg (DUF494 family)
MSHNPQTILGKLNPSSRQLLYNLFDLYPRECKTSEFQDSLQEQLTGYGWRQEDIKQAISELQEIADGQK